MKARVGFPKRVLSSKGLNLRLYTEFVQPKRPRVSILCRKGMNYLNIHKSKTIPLIYRQFCVKKSPIENEVKIMKVLGSWLRNLYSNVNFVLEKRKRLIQNININISANFKKIFLDWSSNTYFTPQL